MSALRIEFEWVDGGSSPDRLARSTLADIRIHLDGQVISSNIDTATRAYREILTAPLHPIAEWVVSNWWALWFEPGSVGPGQHRPGYLERHDLSFAGRGFLYPRLVVDSRESVARVRSSRWRPEHASIEFIRSGSAEIDPGDLQAEFSRIVEAVLDRLRCCGFAEPELEEDWNVIRSADPETVEFCVAAARLGLDPYDLDEASAAAVERLWERAPLAMRDELLGCAEPETGETLLCWIDRARDRAERHPGAGCWADLRRAIGHLVPGRPWEQGYALAREARRVMSVPGGKFSFESPWILTALKDTSPSERLEGVVASSSPSCVIPPRPHAGERFLVARAVGDYLARCGDEPSLLTTLGSDRQSRSRAFAAEFLAPSALLRDRLGRHVGGEISTELVEDLAAHFDVSESIIRWQVRNHRIGACVEPF